MSNIEELFIQGRNLLKNFPKPDIEARLLILKSTSLSETQFYASPERQVSKKEEKSFYRLLSRRLKGFPVAYLTGKKEFWSLDFIVCPGVLIPRPETELVVEKAISSSSKGEEIVVDVGTGCGNIAIALAKELPASLVFATDIFRKAIKIAKKNASINKISRINFLHGNLLKPLQGLTLEGRCDIIVSNPPYVTEEEWRILPEEIRHYEPKKALVAGKSGLEIIYKLIEGVSKFLKPGGFVIFEIGLSQKDRVLSIFNNDWSSVECFDDLSGIPRVVSAQKGL